MSPDGIQMEFNMDNLQNTHYEGAWSAFYDKHDSTGAWIPWLRCGVG